MYTLLTLHVSTEEGKSGVDLSMATLLIMSGVTTSTICVRTVDLLAFFCSGIQFNVLLSPDLCFISFLFLDLYVLGDDALIS